MDTPLHLRLAYAGRFTDPYADPQRTVRGAASLGECLPTQQQQSPSWFNKLVQHLLENGESTKSSAPLECSPQRSEFSSLPDVAPLRDKSVRQSPVDVVATPAPTPSPPSPESLECLTAEEVCAPHGSVSSAPFLKGDQRPPCTTGIAVSDTLTDATVCEKKNEKSSAPAALPADVAAQADVAADEALQERRRDVQSQLAGTHQVLLANVAASLEQRIQKCVLQTAAFDDANQQLICAFQLPPTSSPSVGASSQPQHSRNNPNEEQNAQLIGGSVAPPPNLPAPSAAAPTRSDASIVANRSDAALPEEARKELAMHLYALRHQVVEMRHQLDAHEMAHARQVNAFRAGARDTTSPPSHRPPVRVEVVKAYTDEPVPYRKGPWRQADFAAAATATAATASNNIEKRSRRQDVGTESNYSSDQFTSDTNSQQSSGISTDVDSSTSSVQQTAKSGGGINGGEKRVTAASGKKMTEVVSSVDSDSSSLSSTEDLFRRRQAAALQARAQRAVMASAPARHNNNSSTSSSSYDSSESSYTSRTSTFTSSITDTS